MATYTPTATEIVHYTKADFRRRPIVEAVHIVQYDDSMPILAVELYSDGLVYQAPSTNTFRLRFGHGDGTFSYVESIGTNADRSLVYFRVTPAMTYKFGLRRPVVEMTASDTFASSSEIPIAIDRNPIQESDEESYSEYSGIQSILAGKIDKSAQSTKIDSMTAPVGIDSNGKLWSVPGGGGSGGSLDHNLLYNRDMADQHPISAVEGLQTALDNLGTEKIDAAAQAEKTSSMTSPVGIDFDGKLWSVPGGTTDHNSLTNRDASNQHPISSIINLSDTLANKINVNAQNSKSAEMTSPIGIDSDGKLWSAPGGGGGGLPDPSSLEDGTAIIKAGDSWTTQEGYGYYGEYPAASATYFDPDLEEMNFKAYKIASFGSIPASITEGTKVYARIRSIQTENGTVIYDENEHFIGVLKRTENGILCNDEIEAPIICIVPTDNLSLAFVDQETGDPSITLTFSHSGVYVLHGEGSFDDGADVYTTLTYVDLVRFEDGTELKWNGKIEDYHKISPEYTFPNIDQNGQALVSINGKWEKQEGYGYTEDLITAITSGLDDSGVTFCRVASIDSVPVSVAEGSRINVSISERISINEVVSEDHIVEFGSIVLEKTENEILYDTENTTLFIVPEDAMTYEIDDAEIIFPQRGVYVPLMHDEWEESSGEHYASDNYVKNILFEDGTELKWDGLTKKYHKIFSKLLPSLVPDADQNQNGQALVNVNGKWEKQDGYGYSEELPNASLIMASYYKVAELDAIPETFGDGSTATAFLEEPPSSIDMEITFNIDGDVYVGIEQQGEEAQIPIAFVAMTDGATCIYNFGLDAIKITFPNSGVYFVFAGEETFAYVSKLVFSDTTEITWDGSTSIIHKIDSKYLPEVRELPEVTSADNGKGLFVENGEWIAKTSESHELPEVTSADNGKGLFVENGEWAAKMPENQNNIVVISATIIYDSSTREFSVNINETPSEVIDLLEAGKNVYIAAWFGDTDHALYICRGKDISLATITFDLVSASYPHRYGSYDIFSRIYGNYSTSESIKWHIQGTHRDRFAVDDEAVMRDRSMIVTVINLPNVSGPLTQANFTMSFDSIVTFCNYGYDIRLARENPLLSPRYREFLNNGYALSGYPKFISQHYDSATSSMIFETIEILSLSSAYYTIETYSATSYRTIAEQDAIDATKYVKPLTGIPASDIADGVIPKHTITTAASSIVTLTTNDTKVLEGTPVNVSVTLPTPSSGYDYTTGIIFKAGAPMTFSDTAPDGYVIVWNTIPTWTEGKVYEINYRCLWISDENGDIIISAKWNQI